MKFKALAAGLAILAGSAAVSAQTFALVPAQPQTFDPLVLRMTVDSCVYDQDRISVSASQGVFRVFIAVNPCLVPGPLKVIDVRLGALPAGPGRVEVFQIVGGDLLVRLEGGNIDFNVTGRPVIAVFPPPKKPNNDWSGNWVTQTELGWGLSIQQSPTDVLFAQLFVYAVNGAPVWFTFQEGQSWQELGLTGDETVTIEGIAGGLRPRQMLTALIASPEKAERRVELLCRIDTLDELDYFQNGGILPYVLRKLVA